MGVGARAHSGSKVREHGQAVVLGAYVPMGASVEIVPAPTQFFRRPSHDGLLFSEAEACVRADAFTGEDRRRAEGFHAPSTNHGGDPNQRRAEQGDAGILDGQPPVRTAPRGSRP